MAYTTSQIQQMVIEAAARYGVDPALALAVAKNESSFRANAVSGAGAIGVMQLMPPTAKDLGVDPYDPVQNVDGGVRYLSQMLSAFNGDPAKALAAYNFGIGRVSRGETWPAETKTYVSRVYNSWRDYSKSAPVVPLVPAAGMPVYATTVWGTYPSDGEPEVKEAGLGSSSTLLVLLLAALVSVAVSQS